MSKAGKKLIAGAKEAREWAANYGPGTMGCHEALHMTNHLAEEIERALVTHPTIKAVPKWRTKADAAMQSLHELYQAIGEEHLK